MAKGKRLTVQATNLILFMIYTLRNTSLEITKSATAIITKKKKKTEISLSQNKRELIALSFKFLNNYIKINTNAWP